MTWSFSDGIIRVEKVGAGWLYVNWVDQSREKFFGFVKRFRKLEKIARKQGARGLLIDTAADNTHMRDMLERDGAKKYDERDGLIFYKKEVA